MQAMRVVGPAAIFSLCSSYPMHEEVHYDRRNVCDRQVRAAG
jgi:hypothetical protein